jgi:hypothetical protein
MKTPVEPEIRPANRQHNNQTRQDDSGCSQDTSPESSGGITDVCSTVDTDRTGRNLADSNNIDELLLAHPSVLFHFHLDQRQDSQAPSESEESDLEERYEELQIKHLEITN